MTERLVVIMCEKKELSFSIFMLYSLADKWKMSPAKVYKILNSTGILDSYTTFFNYYPKQTMKIMKVFLYFILMK